MRAREAVRVRPAQAASVRTSAAAALRLILPLLCDTWVWQRRWRAAGAPSANPSSDLLPDPESRGAISEAGAARLRAHCTRLRPDGHLPLLSPVGAAPLRVSPTNRALLTALHPGSCTSGMAKIPRARAEDRARDDEPHSVRGMPPHGLGAASVEGRLHGVFGDQILSHAWGAALWPVA